MHAKRILACLITLAFSACAPDHIAPTPVARPVETVPITPLVEKARQEAADARETASQLSDKVDVLHDQTAKLGTGLKAATAEADRLRQQKAASEKELEGLWQMLTNEQARAAEMFRQVETSKELAALATKQRMLAETRLGELTELAAARDSEVANLRLHADGLSAQIVVKDRTIKMQSGQISELERKAAVGSYLKGCIWFLGIAATVCAALYVLTKLKLL